MRQGRSHKELTEAAMSVGDVFTRLWVVAFHVSAGTRLACSRTERTPVEVTDRSIQYHLVVVKDAVQEAVLLYARQYLDFFYPTSPKSDDIVVTDFGSGAEAWIARVGRGNIVADVRQQTGKLVAHLTYRRFADDIRVNTPEIVELARDLARSFNMWVRVPELQIRLMPDYGDFEVPWTALPHHSDPNFNTAANVLIGLRVRLLELQQCFPETVRSDVVRLADECKAIAAALLAATPGGSTVSELQDAMTRAASLTEGVVAGLGGVALSIGENARATIVSLRALVR